MTMRKGARAREMRIATGVLIIKLEIFNKTPDAVALCVTLGSGSWKSSMAKCRGLLLTKRSSQVALHIKIRREFQKNKEKLIILNLSKYK